jgi:hypothetical protein
LRFVLRHARIEELLAVVASAILPDRCESRVVATGVCMGNKKFSWTAS